MQKILEHDAGGLTPALKLVSKRFGPLLDVIGERSPDGGGWWIYRCPVARPLGRYFMSESLISLGCSIDGDEALQRALAEAVERYCATNALWQQESLNCRIRVADNPLFERLPRCLDSEHSPQSFKALDDRAVLTHSPVKRLADDSPAMLPTPFVHLEFGLAPEEPLVTNAISTGLAFHTDLTTSIWHGICEVVERDATMMWWLKKTPSRRIATKGAGVPDSVKERIERLQATGVRVHLTAISAAVSLPTVVCVLESDRYPYVVASSATGGNAERCCTRAIDEAAANGFAMMHEQAAQAPGSFSDFSWVTELDSHALLYAAWAKSPAFEFMANNESVSFDRFAEENWLAVPHSRKQLESFAGSLLEQGFTILWADLTTQDVADFGHVARAVIPEMIPLAVQHDARWLSSPRLADLTSASINPYPHPFA